MSILELFLLAVGLSMDAFAVAVCKGLAAGKVRFRHMLIPGAWFGVFQALMPLIGYLEALRSEPGEEDASLKVKVKLPLALATRIDALAVGVTFAFLQVRIVPAVSFIGVVTFLLSMAGVKIGSIFGVRWRKGAQIAGGVILILLGLKILLEHLGVISF